MQHAGMGGVRTPALAMDSPVPFQRHLMMVTSSTQISYLSRRQPRTGCVAFSLMQRTLQPHLRAGIPGACGRAPVHPNVSSRAPRPSKSRHSGRRVRSAAVTDPPLADLQEFGSPIYVPSSSPWRVAGVEHTDGKADACFVFGDNGAIEVRTESTSRPRQPLSLRVQNLQIASAPQQSSTPEWQRILVHEVEESVVVDGVDHPVRVLKSDRSFSFELQLENRVVRAAGTLGNLAGLELERLDDLEVSG